MFKRKGDATTVRINRSTIAALDVAPIATISWLTRANPMLDGETLLACLKAGEIDRVVALARAVGMDWRGSDQSAVGYARCCSTSCAPITSSGDVDVRSSPNPATTPASNAAP